MENGIKKHINAFISEKGLQCATLWKPFNLFFRNFNLKSLKTATHDVSFAILFVHEVIPPWWCETFYFEGEEMKENQIDVDRKSLNCFVLWLSKSIFVFQFHEQFFPWLCNLKHKRRAEDKCPSSMGFQILFSLWNIFSLLEFLCRIVSSNLLDSFTFSQINKWLHSVVYAFI